MGRVSDTLLAALAIAVAGAGCSSILGVQDIEVDPSLASPVFSDPDASADPGCVYAKDCPDLDTTPSACAEPECVAGKCTYRAIDKDQDGHRGHACAPTDGTTPIELGDDCDDTDPQLFPDHPADCSQDETGKPLAFPNGQPVGACKFGKRSCNPDGTATACVGGVGPQPVTSCTPNVDEACTGNPLEGCSCTAGQTTPCGSSSTGACKAGTSTCQANNTFGPCVGNVEPAPRNCGSNLDNDCNGAIDNTEASCQCPGGSAPNATRACNTHPGYDGVGVCKPGSQTCTPNGMSSAWSACAGDVAPSSEKCDGLDHNCNGVTSTNEPAPPPPANTGAVNCAKLYLCDAADRGPVYYRTGIGWTWYSGSGTLWTGYALDGAHANSVALGRDSATGKAMGVLNGTCGGKSIDQAMTTYRTLQ